MDINIKVRVDSPDIMNALLALAEALPKMQLGTSLPVKEGQAIEAKKSAIKNEELSKEEIKKEEVKEITLQEVRSILARLSKNGKQAEVKGLIKKFGAKKLTGIPKEKYGELLKEAEVI